MNSACVVSCAWRERGAFFGPCFGHELADNGPPEQMAFPFLRVLRFNVSRRAVPLTLFSRRPPPSTAFSLLEVGLKWWNRQSERRKAKDTAPACDPFWIKWTSEFSKEQLNKHGVDNIQGRSGSDPTMWNRERVAVRNSACLATYRRARRTGGASSTVQCSRTTSAERRALFLPQSTRLVLAAGHPERHPHTHTVTRTALATHSCPCPVNVELIYCAASYLYVHSCVSAIRCRLVQRRPWPE